MNWTMPYPWRSRRDNVRRINMSSEPGNESFFCALRPIPRILSLRRRYCASQVQIGEPSRRKTISGCLRAPDANRYVAHCRCRQQATSADIHGDVAVGEAHQRLHGLHILVDLSEKTGTMASDPAYNMP